MQHSFAKVFLKFKYKKYDPQYVIATISSISSTGATSQQVVHLTRISLQVRIIWTLTRKWSTFYLHWKLRGGNVVPSQNLMEVKLCADGLREHIWLRGFLHKLRQCGMHTGDTFVTGQLPNVEWFVLYLHPVVAWKSATIRIDNNW